MASQGFILARLYIRYFLGGDFLTLKNQEFSPGYFDKKLPVFSVTFER